MKKLFLLALVVVFATVYQIQKWSHESGPLTEIVNVVIPRGATSRTVAARLDAAGVINKPWLFRIMARLNRLDKHLKAGEYQFSPMISMQAALDKMARGEIFYRRITLAEGLTTREMINLLNAEPMLSGEVTLAVKEGELLPETYTYVRGDTRNSIVMQAAKAMQKVKRGAWEKREPGLPLKNADEMMVLASIIEKETAVPAERGLVASVFVNRLKKGMRLQTDPTVIYALTRGESELERPLYKKDLSIDSPYNTYKNYGLPPTPICNPGRASIEAAVNPELSNYLYFVASGNGGHNFAASLNEHNRNVKDWRRQRKK